MIEFEFPFAITVNHYLGRTKNGRDYIKPKALEFRQDVIDVCLLGYDGPILDGPLMVEYMFWYPDNRRRDVFNLEKFLTDSIQKAGNVFVDDKQIEIGIVKKMGVLKPEGKTIARIWEKKENDHGI